MSPASLRSAGEAGLPGVGVCVRMPRRLVTGSAFQNTVRQTVFWPRYRKR